MTLTFHTLGEPKLEVLRTWFTDPELARRISFPTIRWFDYVRPTPMVYAWLIYDEDIPIGQVQVDIDAANNAFAAPVVKREFRN